MRFLMMLLMLVSFSHAESVKVFVLNGKSGRPLSRASVSVQLFYDNPAKVTTPLSLETSPEGSVDFGLPSPLPNHIGVQVSLKYYACECGLMADTKSIVQEGKLVVFRGQKVKFGITPKPGQITFLPLPFTFIQRLLYPLVKY